MQDSKRYECLGLAIAEPEGWVACYRAGHSCPPKEQIREEQDGRVTFRHRCPCCGSGGMTFSILADDEDQFFAAKAKDTARSWDILPPLDELS